MRMPRCSRKHVSQNSIISPASHDIVFLEHVCRRLKVGENVLVEGTIVESEVKFGKKRFLICMLNDDSGSIILKFFNLNKFSLDENEYETERQREENNRKN